MCHRLPLTNPQHTVKKCRWPTRSDLCGALALLSTIYSCTEGTVFFLLLCRSSSSHDTARLTDPSSSFKYRISIFCDSVSTPSLHAMRFPFISLKFAVYLGSNALTSLIKHSWHHRFLSSCLYIITCLLGCAQSEMKFIFILLRFIMAAYKRSIICHNNNNNNLMPIIWPSYVISNA